MAQNLHPGGTRGPFTYDFESLSSDDIKVSVEGNLKSPSTYDLVYNSDTGGTVTFKNDQPVPPSGADKVRIFRQTSGSTLKHEFQAGSSIRASDLNINDRQALYVAQENRESLNNLALGGASGVGITINGSHIEDGSIDSDKIANLQVKDVDLSSSTGTDSDRAVTTDHIRDGAVTDAKLATGITGSKVTPNFGSQNIVTTGTLSSGDMTISDNSPRILFTELNADPDYKLISEGGKFIIREEDNQADRLVVNTDGHIDINNHLDVSGGADVTGSLTAQDLTLTNNLTLSDGNADNKGLFFNGDPLGGSDDKAFLRYYSDTGSNGDTRLHLGCLGDTNDEIYLESHKVHTSNNLEVGGVLSAASFLGLPVQDVKVAWNATETNFGNNSSWHTHLEVGPFTNVTNSSKFLIVAVYDIKNESSSTNCGTEARITEVNGTLTNNNTNTRYATSYLKYNHIEFDRASNTSNRTYRLQCRARNSHTSCNAFMDDAFLCVFHLKPS